MKEKKAWEALFTPTPPYEVDFDEAASVVEGLGQVDMSITLDPPVQRCVDEFQMDPAGFLSANVSDPRVPQWTRLATALSVPTTPKPPIRRALSASALMSASVSDGTPTAPVFGSRKTGGTSTDTADSDDSPKREKKKRKEPDRDKDKKKHEPHSDASPAGDKSADGKAKPSADTSQSSPPPDLVHAFQSIQDRGRVVGEIVRERIAATRRETPTAQKKRLDAEAVERQRRLDEDERERQRRQAEEEEALRRRLEIEAKANEEKCLAELRLAAEKQRLDDEAEERREERKRAREEARARKPPESPLRPKPLIDVTDRSIPQITREILAYDSYRTWSSWLIEAFHLIRTGTPAEKEQKRADLPHMRTLIQSMKASQDRMEVQAGFHLDRLLEVLEAGRDQRDPDWFQANYVTGTYTD